MTSRQIKTIIIGPIMIVTAIFLMKFLFSKKKELKPKETPKIIKNVKTQSIHYKNIKSEVVVFGRVTSASPLEVVTEVGGIIKKGNVPLKEGQNFRKGQILFKIDNREAVLSLRSLKSTFMKDLAAILPDLKVDFSSVFQKWNVYFQTIDLEDPLPKLPNVEEQKEKVFLVTKNIFKNYYDIRQREVNLEKYTVKASFSGTIIQVDAHEGSFASQGKQIAKVIETSDLDLKLSIPVENIKWLEIGRFVDIQDESTQNRWKGRINRISKVINQNTQSIDVYVSIFQNSKYPVYEGMYLKASIQTKTFEQVLEVNRETVFNNNQVYIVENDSILKIKNIIIHKVNPETVIISGLDSTSSLVIESLINAYEGMIVKKI